MNPFFKQVLQELTIFERDFGLVHGLILFDSARKEFLSNESTVGKYESAI